MRFTTQLDIKVIGKQAYEVDSPLVYERENQIIQVNPGFDFDGASIPQALWGIVGSPMTGGYQKSACLHDALYASEYFPRDECDAIFLEAMESEMEALLRAREDANIKGSSWKEKLAYSKEAISIELDRKAYKIKRSIMYKAVRMFGGSVWKGHNKNEVKSYRRFITIV